MIPEQREVLDEIVGKIRSGRMTRRTFVERALAVGLSVGAATSLLEACGGTSNSQGGNGQTTNLVWASENDTSGTYQTIANSFNATNSGVHVTWQNGPSSTDNILTNYTTMLRARSGADDVISMDVIYPAEFGSNGWTVPLDSKWPTSERANYLQGPVQSCTYNGQLWAAPFRTDLGVIYYRSDIIKTPPSTWEELTSMAKSNAGKTKFGYVWQASQYEGLVCNFIEVLHGYGGDVLASGNSKSVVVSSPQAVQALTEMVSWVNAISPNSITTYTEEPARLSFQNGDALFMRNWPYAYSLGNDATKSKVAGKFDIHAMLPGGSATTGHSCTGGWNLAINAFSKNPDASWKFMQYMLGPAAQKQAAIGASWTPALQSVYDDPEVLSKQPLFTKLKPILQNALPRPVSAQYPDVTNAIQQYVHQALLKQMSPSDALNALATKLQSLVAA